MNVRFPSLLLMALAGAASGCAPSSSGESAGAGNAGEVAAATAPSPSAAPGENGAVPAAPVESPPPSAASPRSARDAASLDLPASNAASEPVAFPAEVTSFMVDRDGCDHFRGEEPYDAERAAFLEENIRELCTGTDAKLARLRARYANDPDVIAALANYEDQVEQPPES